MTDVHFGLLHCHIGHDDSEGHKDVYQIHGDKAEEYVKSDKIAFAYALGCPWAVVIPPFNTHVTIPTVVCPSLYSYVAPSAQSLSLKILPAHRVLLFLYISQILFKYNPWIAGRHCEITKTHALADKYRSQLEVEVRVVS